jgi:hypothetical protein
MAKRTCSFKFICDNFSNRPAVYGKLRSKFNKEHIGGLCIRGGENHAAKEYGIFFSATRAFIFFKPLIAY